MQTCHELHDRLNAGKFKRLFPSMQDLITYMMFPEPTHRASWHDAIRLLEQWCYDLRKIELPGIASAKPVQKRLYVFRFSLDAASRSRERRTITLKDRRAQTLLDSILDNPTIRCHVLKTRLRLRCVQMIKQAHCTLTIYAQRCVRRLVQVRSCFEPLRRLAHTIIKAY